MPDSKLILDKSQLDRVLNRIAHEILEKNDKPSELVLIGVQRRGVFLAQRLAKKIEAELGSAVLAGTLDVAMHRDDLDGKAAPLIHPTEIPFDVTAKTVILVDDVLFSGRTTRAALDALTDFGRPKAVQLAVLIDRGHRQLPIRADFVGKTVQTGFDQRIAVRFKEEGFEDTVHLEKI